MIKIAMAGFGLLLLLVGGMLSLKGEKYFILQPEQLSEEKLKSIKQFFHFNGLIYSSMGVLSFLLIYLHQKGVYALFIVLASFYTAFFSLRLGKLMKTLQ